jgi:hypothetical protein
MSRLQENLDEILRQKQTYLKPENIRQGITAYGVEGAMTSENMWVPLYSGEGSYYIMSFVNLEGNNQVEKIIGYDGYRIVKFYNDTRYYLFDTRMNKPKQLCNSVPIDTKHLLGYTDEAVYLLPSLDSAPSTFTIHKYTLATDEWSDITVSSTSGYGIPDGNTRCYVKNFYMLFGKCADYGNPIGGLKFFNTETETLNNLNFTTSKSTYFGYWYAASSSYYGKNGASGNLWFSGDYIIWDGRSWANSDMYITSYNTSTGATKQLSGAYADIGKLYGFSPSGNHAFLGNEVYNFDINIGLGSKVENVNTGLPDIASISYGTMVYPLIWLSNTTCMLADKLYQYDENTMTFTKMVDQSLYYPQVSTTFKEIITGYTFLGKKYYFNIGNPIIKSDKIVQGSIARDQYNQIVQGTMPNNGQLTYTPSTSIQTIPSGYTSGGTILPVTNEIDADIKPENIRYGVNILGVAGTLEQDAAESVMSQEEYDACMTVANNILGITE